MISPYMVKVAFIIAKQGYFILETAVERAGLSGLAVLFCRRLYAE
jgi:hypothetical protein